MYITLNIQHYVYNSGKNNLKYCKFICHFWKREKVLEYYNTLPT